MARVYLITEEEMFSLIESLEMHRMRAENISDPTRHLNDEWRALSDKEKKNMLPAIDSLHRGFHFVVCRWATSMGLPNHRR